MKLKLKKKHYFIAGGILIFLFLLNLVFANWAKNSFPQFVKEKNDTPYNFEYGDISFSFLGRSLILENISIYPKEDKTEKLKTDFSAKIKKIKISGLDFIELIRNKKLDAGRILISEPDVYYYLTENQNEEYEKTEFQNSIKISNFKLEDADFHLMAQDRKSLISDVDKLNVEFTGVRLDQRTIEKKIPFVFSTYQVNCNSFFYRLNPSQELKSDELKFNNNQLLLFGFSIQTTDSLAAERSVQMDYRLLPDVFSKDFRIGNLDWGFSEEDKFYFKSSKISFDSARIRIPENKNRTKKEKQLGNLIPFFLDVGMVSVKNSELEVEGSLQIDKIDLAIHHIQTDKNKILKIDSILIDKPLLTLKGEKTHTEEKEVLLSSPFREHIQLDKFEIRQAKVKKQTTDNKELKISNKLNLKIDDMEIIPKLNYNKHLKSDNFHVKINTFHLDTDTILIRNNQHSTAKSQTEKPLIPLNIDVKQFNFNTSLISQTGKLQIRMPALSILNLKNELEGKTKIEKLKLNSKGITLHSGGKHKSQNKKNTFPESLEIAEIEIENDNFILLNTNKKKLLSVQNPKLTMSGMKANSAKNSKIPFSYDGISLSVNTLNYHPEGTYDLLVNRVNFSDKMLKISGFELKPKVSKTQFVRSLKKEKDYYAIKVPEIVAQNPGFSFSGKDFFLKIPTVTMNAVDAYIYRSKIPPDDDSKKKMYGQLLRELKFGLEVNKLNIKNSKLIYEEETPTSKGAGKLSFTNFNAGISNVNSGFRKTKLPDVRAEITTSFMNDSRLKVIWTFNPMNRNENFNIRGNIFNFDAKKMSPFIKPYLHATAEGDIQEVEFNFSGNKQSAKGEFGIKYSNLKASLYNPKTGEKRKTISSIGNLALKSNTKNKLNTVDIKEVERRQDRSFFNFFWLCVQQGLKQTILII